MMDRNTALLVIDVQMGMFDEAWPVEGGEALLETIGGLVAKVRRAGTPVIYIQHCDQNENDPLNPGQPGWSIHPAIAPAEGEPVIHKQHPDSFQGTELQPTLDRLGIDHLVLAGMQTEYCIDTTCRRAYSLGYKVTLVQDGHGACNTPRLQASQIIAHHNSVLNTFATLQPAEAIEFERNVESPV